MAGADNLRGRAFAMDIPNAHNGNGRVIMFANNPIYRWQNHGEFNMVFNSIMNWNDVPAAAPPRRQQRALGGSWWTRHGHRRGRREAGEESMTACYPERGICC